MTASGKTGVTIDRLGPKARYQMIITRSHPPHVIRWFCLILAVGALISFLISGFVWYQNDRSGEAVYRADMRGIVKEDITRDLHPAKFREAQTRLVLRMGLTGVLCVIGFGFLRKLGA